MYLSLFLFLYKFPKLADIQNRLMKYSLKNQVLQSLQLLRQGKTNLIKLKGSLPRQVARLFLIENSNYRSNERQLLQSIIEVISFSLHSQKYRQTILIYSKLLRQLSRRLESLSKFIQNSEYCLQNYHFPSWVTQTHLAQMQDDENYLRIQLPNHKYIEQTCFFYEGWKLTFSQSNLRFCCLEQKSVERESELQMALCAVANESKGGVLLIGVSHDLYTQGIFLNEEKKQQIKGKIVQSADKIFPRLDNKHYKIDFIPVFNSFYQSSMSDNHKNIFTNKYVVRILICSPKNRELKVLLKRQYQCSGVYKLVSNTPTSYSLSNSLYQLIHKKYTLNKIRMQRNIQREYFPQPIYVSPLELGKNPPKLFADNQQFFFRYRNSSILYLSSKKKVPLLERIFINLTQNHIRFEKHKPFQFFNKDSNVEIWFISHEDSFMAIEKLKQKVDPSRKIPFFSVQKHIALSIKKENAESDKKLQELRHLFYHKFEKELRIQWLRIQQNNYEQKQVLALLFESFYESLFGFVSLSSMKVPSKFLKQSKVKKCLVLG